MKVVVLSAIALLAGAAGGLGAGLWLARAETHAPVVPPANAPRAEREADVARLLASRLEGPVAAAPVASAATAPQPAAADEPQRVSPEEADARWQQMYQRKVEAVQAEGRDPSWARATEASFQQDLREAAQKHEARLVGLDCRTTGCLARVEWDSYAQAKRKFPDILHASYQVNCATTIDVGPQPEADDRPAQATVVFECEQSRIAGLGGG